LHPVFFLFFFQLFPLFPEEGSGGDSDIEHKTGEPLKALVEVEDDEIVENSLVEIRILVNHGRPEEITAKAPDFNDEWTLEKIVLSPYIMPASVIQKSRKTPDKWTEIAIFLVPLKAGSLKVGSFLISSPFETVRTIPLAWEVKPQKNAAAPVLRWSGVRTLSPGTPAELRLRIFSRDLKRPFPKDIPAYIPAPKNAIVEKLDLTADDRYYGVVFRLRITALDNKTIKLPEVRFEYQQQELVIPALDLPVSASKGKIRQKPEDEKHDSASGQAAGLNAGFNNENTFNNGKKRLNFPVTDSSRRNILALFSGKNRTKKLEQAKKLWDEGSCAGALALLRKGERDSIDGLSYTAIRIAAEKELGIQSFVSEKRRPKAMFLFTCFAALLFAALRLLFFFAKKPPANRNKKTAFPYKSIIIFTFIAALTAAAYFYPDFAPPKSAVMKQSPFFTIPEPDKSADGIFREGAPVHIKAQNGDWFYVESPDSGGWVQKNALVIY